MVKVVYEGMTYEIAKEESLLDGLLNHQVEVPFGCKSGTCQSCLLKCTEGDIPSQAQKGLRESQKMLQLFLACQCYPASNMQVVRPASEADAIPATVEDLRPLNSEIIEVSLKPAQDFTFLAGQFIRLFNPEGIGRPYSLASVHGVDPLLKLHVREYPQGKLSHWIHHELSIGDQVEISQPMGECFYLPGKSEQSLLMIGTGSGLAPLYGILRDALQQGHQGPIHLYHGARTIQGLYLQDELKLLMAQHPQLHYQACVSDPKMALPSGVMRGRASEIALAAHPNLKNWGVFLCGNPEMVRATQMQAFLADAELNEVHADPFDAQSSVS